MEMRIPEIEASSCESNTVAENVVNCDTRGRGSRLACSEGILKIVIARWLYKNVFQTWFFFYQTIAIYCKLYICHTNHISLQFGVGTMSGRFIELGLGRKTQLRNSICSLLWQPSFRSRIILWSRSILVVWVVDRIPKVLKRRPDSSPKYSSCGWIHCWIWETSVPWNPRIYLNFRIFNSI